MGNKIQENKMNDDRTPEHSEVAEEMRQHYKFVCEEAMEEHPRIWKAIDAWERQPELLRENEELKERLAQAKDA